VCAAEKKFINSLTRAELPRVNLIGQQLLTRTDTECMRHMSFAPPDPRPTALGGDRFRVTVDGLSVLKQQSAWGKVSVVRNNRLVEEVGTNTDFVLHINNVSAPQPAVPSIGYAGRLDVADGIGYLAERLAKFLKNFLQLGEPEGLSQQQLSLTLNFARSLVDDSTRLALDPSDPKTMFSPIATLPIVKVALQESDESVTPLAIGKAVQDYLMTWIKDRTEARKGTWSFAFKLFSTSEIDPSQPPLLELADLRVRISDT
jgi:hypothetical protein